MVVEHFWRIESGTRIYTGERVTPANYRADGTPFIPPGVVAVPPRPAGERQAARYEPDTAEPENIRKGRSILIPDYRGITVHRTDSKESRIIQNADEEPGPEWTEAMPMHQDDEYDQSAGTWKRSLQRIQDDLVARIEGIRAAKEEEGVTLEVEGVAHRFDTGPDVLQSLQVLESRIPQLPADYRESWPTRDFVEVVELSPPDIARLAQAAFARIGEIRRARTRKVREVRSTKDTDAGRTYLEKYDPAEGWPA